MSYSKMSPYVRPEQIAINGRHRNEDNFWSQFKERHCPPGRINRIPIGKKRIRTVQGYENPDVKRLDATTNLLAEYDTLRAQGKVRAQGAGHEPWRWQYKWPEEVKIKTQEAERYGLSREPFLNLLLKPISQRPKTFAECVSFFYPVSSLVPPAIGISPFVNTSVHAYYVEGNNTALPGDIPLQLGEVSMMYGWYLAFRAILCPEEAKNTVSYLLLNDHGNTNPAFPFSPVGQVELDSGQRTELTKNAKEKVNLLNNISTAVSLLEVGASAVASGKVKIPTDAPQLLDQFGNILESDAVRDMLQTYGTAAVASILNQQLDMPYEHANDLSTLVIEGVVSPDKFKSLWNDRGDTATATRNMYEGFVENKIKRLFPEGSSLQRAVDGVRSTLDEFYISGEPSEGLEDAYRRAKSKAQNQLVDQEKVIIAAYEERQRELQRLAESKLEDFSKFGNARKNPLAFAPLAVALTASAIQGGIDYQRNNAIKGRDKALRYLNDHLYRLSPQIVTSDIVFELGAHIRKGFWDDGSGKAWYDFSKNDWLNAKLRPDCKLQQGGQVLDYWTHAWARVRTIVQKFEKQRDLEFQRLGALAAQATRYPFGIRDLLAEKHGDLYRVYNSCATRDYRGTVNRAPGSEYREECLKKNFAKTLSESYHREQGSVNKGHTRCQGLGILADNVDHSILLVMGNLSAFSPFTHAYGFAPTFQRDPATGILNIDGKAPRRFLGPSSMVYKDNKNRFRASAAPGRIYPSGNLDRANSYGLMGVECWARESPLPSRRLLESAYGQRCNISFDVGIDSRVPVMDAQFCGLMACLLLHPEALETSRKLGYAWAEDIYEKKQNSIMQMLQKIDPKVLQAAFSSVPVIAPQAFMRVQPGLFNLPANFINTLPSKREVIKFTPAMRDSMSSLAKEAMLNNIKLNPNVLAALKRTGATLAAQKQTKAAQSRALSTTQKIASAVTVTAVTAGLSYVVYQVYKAGK